MRDFIVVSIDFSNKMPIMQLRQSVVLLMLSFYTISTYAAKYPSYLYASKKDCNTIIDIDNIVVNANNAAYVSAMTGSGCCGDLCDQFDPPLTGSGCSDLLNGFEEAMTGSGCSPFSANEFESELFCIGGQIKSFKGLPVPKVGIKILTNLEQYPRTIEASNNGVYAFSHNPIGFNYTVSALKTDQVSNDISVSDILVLYRHLTSEQPFMSPYQMIAGDINLDQRVSQTDLFEIVRLLLGIQDEFSSQKSWVFIDAQQDFGDDINPWPLTEELYQLNLDTNQMKENFIGIKLGDLTGNGYRDYAKTIVNRSNDPVNLHYQDQLVQAGDQVSISIKSNNLYNIEAMRLAFQSNGIAFESLQNKGLEVPSELINLKQNHIDLFWLGSESLQKGELFVLRGRATKKGLLSDMLSMSRDQSKAYKLGFEYEAFDINLSGVQDEEKPFSLSLNQNQPNPFSDYTMIQFSLPLKTKARIELFSSSGKLLLYKQINGQQGVNQVEIQKEDLEYSGLIYYSLIANGERITKRMIRTN